MKNYKLEELNNLISNRVSKLEIPDELKMYITDILMRRAYQYDFTNEAINILYEDEFIINSLVYNESENNKTKENVGDP